MYFASKLKKINLKKKKKKISSHIGTQELTGLTGPLDVPTTSNARPLFSVAFTDLTTRPPRAGCGARQALTTRRSGRSRLRSEDARPARSPPDDSRIRAAKLPISVAVAIQVSRIQKRKGGEFRKEDREREARFLCEGLSVSVRWWLGLGTRRTRWKRVHHRNECVKREALEEDIGSPGRYPSRSFGGSFLMAAMVWPVPTARCQLESQKIKKKKKNLRSDGLDLKDIAPARWLTRLRLSGFSTGPQR